MRKTRPLPPGRGVPITVATERRRVDRVIPVAAYRTLGRRFGDDQVYLLESSAGPAEDGRLAAVGFHELFTLTVTRGTVKLGGVGEIVSAVRDEASDLLLPAPDGLRLANDGALWDVLRAVHRAFAATGSADEFSFGFLCFFGYDAVRHIEKLPYRIPATSDMPDVSVVLYQGCLLQDGATGRSELLVHQSDAWPRLPPEEIVTLLEAATQEPQVQAPPPQPASVVDDTEAAEYHAIVGRCLGHIAIGDIYQVQVGHEMNIRSAARPIDVYRRLRLRNPSPYMYLAPLAGHTIIGASPELFARVERGVVMMRPIAGTLPREANQDADVAALRLQADPKEVAEHVMLVDLCRNDIGRICRQDSLRVPDMLSVERYSHMTHLVSTVTGEVEESFDSYDIVTALFPAGTMTGAPKVRAMEIVEDQESSRRGLYAGAIGLIDVGGYVNLALCIRTLFHRGSEYRIRASAGVVADSRPEREWRETLAKLGAGYWAVTGRELVA